MQDGQNSDPDERIEHHLSELGSDHEPPPGWEARVLAGIGQRRQTIRYALETAVPVLLGAGALLLGFALGRCL
jgi:hypothetical protein